MADPLRTELLRPRTPIARARAGERVKIVGRLRPTGALFTAPLSGATCLWYRSAAQIYRGFRYAADTITEERCQNVFIDDETGSALVQVAGAAIDHEEAVFDWCYEPPAPGDERVIATTENVRRFFEARGATLRYHRTPFHLLRNLLRGQLDPVLFGNAGVPERRAARYRELVLRAGDRVAVAGLAIMRPDPAAYPRAGREPALQLVLGEPPEAVVLSNRPSTRA